MGPIPRGRRSGYTSQRPAKDMRGRAWNKRSPKRKGRVYTDSGPDLGAESLDRASGEQAED